MSIIYNEEQKSFHLTNGEISYQFSVEKDQFLVHNYWGKAIHSNRVDSDFPLSDRSFSPSPYSVPGREFSLNNAAQEFPVNGFGDYRETALELRYKDDSFVTQLSYEGYEISEGKPTIEGLPQTYLTNQNEAETVKVFLKDNLYDVSYTLNYTIFKQYPIITRSVHLLNTGEESIEINKLLSASVDFDHSNFDFIQLSGAWGREREIRRNPLSRGIHKIDSKRGTTAHTYQPFFALTEPHTTEHSGEVYGFHFVYTGEFVGSVEVSEYDHTRAQMGINPDHFNWKLEPNAHFQTPEVVMVYSDKGTNSMSQALHQLYQNHLIRGQHQFEERPVLINNWEATYFDFSEEKIEEIAEESAALGIELFVLDDGWFGKRDDDTTSLGDWFVYENKLPKGLKSLAESVKGKGMKFGLWFEPEMISEDSELYKQHPEWVLKAKDRNPSHSREQYILDYSQKEARDYIVEQIRTILNEVPIDYIKWDYNRNLTEIGSQSVLIRDGEVSHRFVLGLYEILEELVTAYPNILWESCSGGGGRYDPGMLYYMPQTWTSDNTDAVARLKIQTGTSFIMPISSMGAHVSAVPNHQVNRTTSLKMRGDVAMAGNLGYELDVTKLSDEEKEVVKKQVSFYKKHRKLIQYGDFYRIINPFEKSNQTAWIFVDKTKDEALFYYYTILAESNSTAARVKFVGLNPNKKYQLNQSDVFLYGNELMHKGLYMDPEASWLNSEDQHHGGDFSSFRLKLESIK